jgi:hypothetical protein
MDIYDSNGYYINEIHTSNGAASYPNYPTWTTVPWGSNGWVHLVTSFTVPNTYIVASWGGNPKYIGPNNPVTDVPAKFIPYISDSCANQGSEQAKIWVYGTELYIT